MPRSKRTKPIYQRGPYALYARSDRPNLEIVWYDKRRGRERSISARTSDHEEGKLALDRHYLEAEGRKFCPTCGHEFSGEVAPLLLDAIADYLLQIEHKAGFPSARGRLAHVVDFLEATDPATTVPMISPEWVDEFRVWLASKPVISPKGRELRKRAPGAIEGCVVQLAAAINATPGHVARFSAQPLKEVSASPRYRADVKTMAAMFRYCVSPTSPSGETLSAKELDQARAYRENLLRYLRIAVATWARPDAIHDLTAAQWYPEAGVLDLNPAGRKQTRKYRPVVPVPHQLHAWLHSCKGLIVPVATIRGPRDRMRDELGLPKGGEAGSKLIRRSMATLARKRLGEAQWVQGHMMLGHKKATTSDIYALPDPANLGGALLVTEGIIDEIEQLAPGAFTATLPQ